MRWLAVVLVVTLGTQGFMGGAAGARRPVVPRDLSSVSSGATGAHPSPRRASAPVSPAPGLVKDVPHLPAWWLRQAHCIEWAESRGTNATSNHVSRGYFQITYGTWASVGGHGDPVNASYREQRWRAYLIWRRDGGSWREWSTAAGCGLD